MDAGCGRNRLRGAAGAVGVDAVRRRPRYLYVLPCAAALAIWIAQIGLARGISHRLDIEPRWSIVAGPGFLPERLGGITVGSTTKQEVINFLGEPKCQLFDGEREILVYRMVQIRDMKDDRDLTAQFEERGTSRKLLVHGRDSAEEVLLIVTISGDKVSGMKESRTALTMGELEFSCDLLSLHD